MAVYGFSLCYCCVFVSLYGSYVGQCLSSDLYPIYILFWQLALFQDCHCADTFLLFFILID